MKTFNYIEKYCSNNPGVGGAGVGPETNLVIIKTNSFMAIWKQTRFRRKVFGLVALLVPADLPLPC